LYPGAVPAYQTCHSTTCQHTRHFNRPGTSLWHRDFSDGNQTSTGLRSCSAPTWHVAPELDDGVGAGAAPALPQPPARRPGGPWLAVTFPAHPRRPLASWDCQDCCNTETRRVGVLVMPSGAVLAGAPTPTQVRWPAWYHATASWLTSLRSSIKLSRTFL